MENASPKVSVIIPAYNMASYIGEAILSVLEGDFADVEILIIDDGSSDDTQQILTTFTDPKQINYDPRVRYVFQENGGKASAVNYGLKLARGRYVTILDADDELPPDSISSRYPKNGAAPDMVIGGFEVIDNQQVLGKRAQPEILEKSYLSRQILMGYKTPFHLNSCLLSRPLIDRTGMFDVQLARCQDIDYSLRCLKQTNTITAAPAIVYRYRKHRTSIKNRLRFRYKTTFHRPRVVWKNAEGVSKFFLVPYGIGMDIAKMAFELVGNYTR